MIYYLKLYFARSLDDVMNLVNGEVFDGKLEKIIEVTYSYKQLDDGYLYNETLFEEYLNIPYTENINYNILGKKFIYRIQSRITAINDSIKKLEHINVSSRVESVKRSILIDSLLYVKNILEISLISINFELNKAGAQINMPDSEVDLKIEKIIKKEKLAFGSLIIENSREFSHCYNFIEKNHSLQKHLLSRSDVIKMNKFLKIIKQSSKCDLIETDETLYKTANSIFSDSNICRKDYRYLFDAVCELYHLPQRTSLTNAGSIYDGDDALEIPRNEEFSHLTFDRVLKLLTHEIESHYINQYNGKKLLGNFRGARNLPKEEGLAMFMERIFHGYTYDTIDNIIDYFFTILAGECLNGDDFSEFVRIMVKEYNFMRSYDTAIRRAKRNYSFEHVGVQHKDVVYFRGLTEVMDYLKSGGEFKKLFLGKVGFLDLDNMYDLYQRYDKKENIVFPIFISDLICYYFENKQEDKMYEFESQKYYLFLKKKYWFLDLDGFKIIQKIETDWIKIEKILKNLEKILDIKIDKK
ncbi:DUF1704 domain-containing protein [Candidatus Gracilibacteria bacterium]|nr:DUF1704 domain-containing protein [Candidatus Gracilibacteria bacterium]